MRKILIIVSLLLILSGCSGSHSNAPEISPVTSIRYIDKSEIVSFTFNEKTDTYNAEYSANCIDFAAVFSYGNGPEAGKANNVTWDKEKWDSFIRELYDCGVLDWNHRKYKADEPGDWSIVMTGDFGITTISGSGSYPPKWQEYKDILSNYFRKIKQYI